MRKELSYFILTGVLFFSLPARAVVFYSNGDPAYNTTAPTGLLANSGWQFQGTFNDFLGTPIAPHHFITAAHIGGSVGDAFTFNGVVYTTIAKADDPQTDLRLWEVDGTFPSYAPLYTATDEVGKNFVVFGRGWDRGAEVFVNGELRGWRWGSNTKVQRWGENVVSGLSNGGSFLAAEFNYGAGANECMLSGGDSGGGVFIKDGGVWKLAGINYAVDPLYFSYDSNGANEFPATLFDFSRSGKFAFDFYYKSGTNWNTAYNNGKDVPCHFYPTRISPRYAWITNNIPDFDQDVDGMPDWYEVQYGGDATSMISTNDLDGDGFSNFEEWVSDTIPNDSNSYLHVTGYINPAEIVFACASDRKYQIQYRTNLTDTNESWQAEPGYETWFTPAGSPSINAVSTASSNRFYRVGVKVR